MTNEEAKEFLTHYICSCQYGTSPMDCDNPKCKFGIAIRTLCDNARSQGEWVGNKIISCGTILKRGTNVLEQQCTKCKRFNIKWVDSISNNFCPSCGAKMEK